VCISHRDKDDYHIRTLALVPSTYVTVLSHRTRLEEVRVHPFRVAIEARDTEAAAAVLADDVVFRSPIAYKPYIGRSATLVVLAAVKRAFDDFTFECELMSEDGRDHALMFRARVDGKDIQGCDFLRHDQDGRVVELTVMVRPLTAAVALRDRVAAEVTRA
jgi:ketosteroid isomerase-like protein